MTIDLDQAQLTRVAERALDAHEATLLDYEVHPLGYDAYLPGRTVARVDGHATVAGRRTPWSAILCAMLTGRWIRVLRAWATR